MQSTGVDLSLFLRDLDLRSRNYDAPQRVQELLKEALPQGLDLPKRYFETDTAGYARHLLARFGSGTTAIVMVWGEGQGTPLHDHAGIWCVEGVVKGRIAVEHYNLIEDNGATCRFEKADELHTTVGDAGALIPPVEHHTLANDRDEPSATLHVYGGEMDSCTIFLPDEEEEGLYHPQRKSLTYTSNDPLWVS